MDCTGAVFNSSISDTFAVGHQFGGFFNFFSYNTKVARETCMTTQKQNIGKLGEDVAVKYLENHGYKILERNYRKPWGEIDIVAQQSDELVFVEVKTQNQEFEWRPEENVTRHKKRQLSKIINTYLKEHRVYSEIDFRVDVLGIIINDETKIAQIEHIQNIIL